MTGAIRRRLLLSAASAAFALPALRRSAAAPRHTTLHRQHVVGYQGWFACPDDPNGRGWVHWFQRMPNGSLHPTFDMLPDTSEFEQDEGCPTPWNGRDGRRIRLFSSQDARTVRRHFRWMREHDIHCAALQRFASSLAFPWRVRQVDKVLTNVQAAAEDQGRAFFVMYDMSGGDDAGLVAMLNDWRGLVARGLTRSSAYQWHRGRPVLGLWGVGFEDRALSPGGILATFAELRDGGEGETPTIVTGVPLYWRTGRQPGASDPRWSEVHARSDVVSPWTVGAFGGRSGADRYLNNVLLDDLKFTKNRGQEIMPVIFPGFSWHNLMRARGRNAALNAIRRECGEFYLHQARNVVNSGAEILYTAMFDEVDEATAIFKTGAENANEPRDHAFVSLDEDGCALPSDWYLQLASRVSGGLRSGRLELQ